MKNLEDSFDRRKSKEEINYRFVGGVYPDGMPWSGVLAEVRINSSRIRWNFSTHTASSKPKPVTDLMKEYESISGKKARIAWNGGYILNPELVGKLGLPRLALRFLFPELILTK
ncbi:MAG: hypothetical protein B6240_07985 [Desulfobacteraceae bacterium 4572_87]|nr:MAG: hypothetical protein B6240_07985 [Desulfobacteraceae bacterium 4572_87]